MPGGDIAHSARFIRINPFPGASCFQQSGIGRRAVVKIWPGDGQEGLEAVTLAPCWGDLPAGNGNMIASLRGRPESQTSRLRRRVHERPQTRLGPLATVRCKWFDMRPRWGPFQVLDLTSPARRTPRRIRTDQPHGFASAQQRVGQPRDNGHRKQEGRRDGRPSSCS